MKKITFVALAALCATSIVWAQSGADFDLKVTALDPTETTLKGPEGANVSASIECVVTLDTRIANVQGWSFGLEFAPAEGMTMYLSALGVATDTITAGPNNDDPSIPGGRPSFQDTAFYRSNYSTPVGKALPNGTCKLEEKIGDPPVATPVTDAVAITQGIVLDNAQVIVLPETAGFELVAFTVDVAGAVATDPKVGEIRFTNVIGEPPVATVIVHGGASYPPAVQQSLPISIEYVPCAAAVPFTMSVSGGGGGTDAEVESVVTLNFNSDGTNSSMIQGWSYGVCATEAKLAMLGATTDGTDTATIKPADPAADPPIEAAGPDFNNITIFPNGVVHGVVIDYAAKIKLAAAETTAWTDLVITSQILMNTEGDAAHISPCSGVLGDPPTTNVMVIDGNSIPASQSFGILPAAEECCNPDVCNKAGKIDFLPGTNVIAGSANGDGKLDIADGIYILNYLFRSGPPLPCEKAGDANGDCALDSADAVYIIYYQFLNGPAPVQGVGCVLIRADTCPALTCDVAECD